MSEVYPSFDKVFESYYSRFSAGCFAPGDVIKFKRADLIKSEHFKSLQPNLRDQLIAMVDASNSGDAVIVVNGVSVSGLDSFDISKPATITIGFSQGGGRIVNLVTIPGMLGEFMEIQDNGVNLNNLIPANAVRNFDETNKVKIEIIDMNKQEKEYQRSSVGNIDKHTFNFK